MMNCKDWKQQFDAWLKEDWAESMERINPPLKLASHADDCVRCGFRFKQFMLLDNRQVPLQVPSEYLVDRINARLSPILEKPLRPRSVFATVPVFAGVVAAAALVFALMFFMLHSNTMTVRFTLMAPGAARVSVVGDWNGWNPEANLLADSNNDGVWEIEIPLMRNKEYRYQFNIDGDLWIPDPESSLQVDDGFGGKNSIIGI